MCIRDRLKTVKKNQPTTVEITKSDVTTGVELDGAKDVYKRQVAMALASVLGARTRKDGYVEGNGYLVSWCVGHLVLSLIHIFQ